MENEQKEARVLAKLRNQVFELEETLEKLRVTEEEAARFRVKAAHLWKNVYAAMNAVCDSHDSTSMIVKDHPPMMSEGWVIERKDTNES